MFARFHRLEAYATFVEFSETNILNAWHRTIQHHPYVTVWHLSLVSRCAKILRPCLVVWLFVGPITGCQTLHPFKKSVQQKTAKLRDWTNSGLEAAQGGRLAQAKSLFTRAADQSPHDIYARVNLARTDAKLGDQEQAIEHMEAAIGLAADDAALHVELGELYLQVGKWDAARRQADLSLELNPRLASGWALSGKTWHAKQEYRRALADYQRSLGYDASSRSQIDSPNHEVQMLIVNVYQALGKPTRALSTVEQLLSCYPPDLQPEAALIAKGTALMKLNQRGPAADVLTLACSREDASVEAFVRLGQAQLSDGNLARARQTLMQASRKHPNSAVLGELTGSLHSQHSAIARRTDAPEPSLMR